MKLSARNVLAGKVLEVKLGATTAHVRLELAGGAVITASITNEAVQELGLKVGDKASITVDALPDAVFTGTVSGIAGGTGSVFTLLPPDNATGNFTKIVQRVPVRIALDRESAARHVLRPGMSVVVKIDPRPANQR